MANKDSKTVVVVKLNGSAIQTYLSHTCSSLFDHFLQVPEKHPVLCIDLSIGTIYQNRQTTHKVFFFLYNFDKMTKFDEIGVYSSSFKQASKLLGS